jgi:hypothetical protein
MTSVYFIWYLHLWHQCFFTWHQHSWHQCFWHDIVKNADVINVDVMSERYWCHDVYIMHEKHWCNKYRCHVWKTPDAINIEVMSITSVFFRHDIYIDDKCFSHDIKWKPFHLQMDDAKTKNSFNNRPVTCL